MTATAVMQLVEKGKLDLDAPFKQMLIPQKTEAARPPITD